MALKHIPLDRITGANLQDLISGGAMESREIDYKRESYGRSDGDVKEILADVSSFANTSGGDIVIGMDEVGGVPTAIVPLQIDADQEITRIESIVRAGLEPRVFGLAFRKIDVLGGFAIVIRAPRSYNPPHRLIRKGPGEMRFYTRSSTGKSEPNVEELRALFGRAPAVAQWMRDFRDKRIGAIFDDDRVPLLDRQVLTLHIVPFSGFDERLALDLDIAQGLWRMFPPIGSSSPQDIRINFDGLLTLSGANQAPKHRAYTQLFHSGAVEAVVSSMVDEHKRLRGLRVEQIVVAWSHRYVNALLNIGARPPFALLVCLRGMTGIDYSYGGEAVLFEDESRKFDRSNYTFTEMIIEALPPDRHQYARQLHSLLDEIANAGGKARSPSFDQAGNFKVNMDAY